jgi:hypothetical protein
MASSCGCFEWWGIGGVKQCERGQRWYMHQALMKEVLDRGNTKHLCKELEKIT